MSLLLPDGRVLELPAPPDAAQAPAYPQMPGAGIVPQAPSAYSFAQPPAPAAAATPAAVADVPKHYSIIGRLLGDKHRDEVASKQALMKFYMDNIHSAYNDPNNTTPDEVLQDWGSKFAGLVGHPDVTKAIKSDVQRFIDSRTAQRNLGRMNAQGPAPQAPPVMPPTQPAAPAGPPAPPTGTAIDNLPWSPQNVAKNQPSPPGPAPIPFGDGDQTGASAPPANIPAPIAVSSAAGGSGFGGPPPVRAPIRGLASSRMTPTDIAMRKTQAEIAASRAMAAYAPEQIANSLGRLKTMGIDVSTLTPQQISEFVAKGIVPPKGFHDLKKGDLGVRDDGTIFYNPEPVTTAPGATTTFPTLPAGVVPGQGYDPNNPNNPMKNTPLPWTGVGAPGTSVKGGPLLSRAQQTANAAWEDKYGTPAQPKDYAQALSEYTESSMSASSKRLRDANITNALEMGKMRKLEEAKFQQAMSEYQRTKGPATIDKLVTQIHDNPDLLQSMSPEIKELVTTAYPDKYGLPAPRALPAIVKTQEEQSHLSINNVLRMRDALNNPVVQKRLGAWDGRIGSLEQAFGDTVGLTPAESEAIQRVRSGMTYLFLGEGKALYGNRPPQSVIDEVRATSPSMKKGMPMVRGALAAVEDMANNNINSANEYRYNQAPGTLAGKGAAPKQGLGGMIIVNADGKDYPFLNQKDADAFKAEAIAAHHKVK